MLLELTILLHQPLEYSGITGMHHSARLRNASVGNATWPGSDILCAGSVPVPSSGFSAFSSPFSDFLSCLFDIAEKAFTL